MAVAGRKPKPEGQRRNRVAPTHEWTEVENRPYAGPRPKLPRREGGWPARTKRWWETISTMPHCKLWTDADWEFALDTAESHARFMQGEHGGTELRIREKRMGTTLDTRRDLRIRYVDPEPEQAEPAGVVQLDDYRDL